MAGNKSLASAALHAIRLVALAGVIGLPQSIPAQESSKPAAPDPFAISREDKQKVFEKLWASVNQKYFDPKFNGVDWPRVKEVYRPRVENAKDRRQLQLVLQQMLDELRSSHLTVSYKIRIKKERIEQDIARKVGRNESFLFDPGIRLTRIETRQVVDAIDEGSGAQLAGVQRGWILIQWNGEPYRGPQFTTCGLEEKVRLRFIDLRGQERDLSVVCSMYPRRLPERITRVLDGGIVYLRFGEFTSGTDNWLADEVARSGQAPAIVIDLRGNRGGLVSVVRRCLKPFFSEARILGKFRQRDGKGPTLKVPGCGKSAYRGRVFMLMDETSSSGAEVFAAGLQEAGRGVVIGRQSSGRVLNNYTQGLSNGFSVTIAIRDYQTAKGIRLEGRGVIPDEPVVLTMKGFLEKRDLDLEQVNLLLHNAKQPAAAASIRTGCRK